MSMGEGRPYGPTGWQGHLGALEPGLGGSKQVRSGSATDTRMLTRRNKTQRKIIMTTDCE